MLGAREMALTHGERLDMLEQQMDALVKLPERIASLEGQFVQFRNETRSEFASVRTEMREGFGQLRAEIHAGDEETRRENIA